MSLEFSPGNSQNTVINTGRIVSTTGQDAGGANIAIIGASNLAGYDEVFNSGYIAGNILLSGGNDIYDGRGGRIEGLVSGGDDNDRLTGGDFADRLSGDNGDDSLVGNGGNDSLDGGAGNDTIFGDAGADTLLGAADNDTLHFDLNDLRFGVVNGGAGYDTGVNTDETTALSISLTAQSLEAYFGSAADEVIIAGTLGGFGAFVRSGAGADLFDGSAQADNVDGGNGVDVLYGRGGADVLAGGLGGDWLQGGTGADVFDYNAGTDSTVNGQDFIADFSTAEGDKINLDDALTNLGFATATFNTGFGTNASVYVFAQGGASLVQVYTGATLQMQLVVSQASLAASDFVL